MRVAALYDIHGNLPALEAVLAEVEREGVDAIVLGGDVVAGPHPRETLARLRALDGDVVWVCGNHERQLADPLALAARRQVPGDRRPLQPADRPLDDRGRRGEGARVALEGCATLRQRRPPAEGEGRLVVVEIVEYLARRLVDDPDAVRVEQVELDGDTIIELYVAKDDVGKVIGRQGRIARALRTIVRASAARREGRTLLEIVE